MIKLMRPEKPAELTEEKEQELITEYKETQREVWRKDYIVENLKQMSNNKCCYCETKLGTQGRALQVEHFHCKQRYPDEVVRWDNLLPACSQCNSNKGTIDTKKEPFLNPVEDNPREYLYLKHYMIKSKDNSLESKGRRTVEELELNHRERLLNPRLQIAETMGYKLRDIHEKAIALKKRTDGKLYNKSRIVNGMNDILKMAQPDAEYSAFMATIILDDEDYVETQKILKELRLWNEELEELHKRADDIKLDTSNK